MSVRGSIRKFGKDDSSSSLLPMLRGMSGTATTSGYMYMYTSGYNLVTLKEVVCKPLNSPRIQPCMVGMTCHMYNEGTKVQNPRRLCHVHVYTLYKPIAHGNMHTRTNRECTGKYTEIWKKTKALSSSSLLPTLRGLSGTA